MKVDVCVDVTAWARVDLDTGKIEKIYTQGYNIHASKGPHFNEVDEDVTGSDDANAAVRAFEHADVPNEIEIEK